MNAAGDVCYRSRTALFDPLLNLAQARVEADGKGVLTRYFHTVVLGRVMRCGNLHRSLEAVVCRAEVHHRRAAKANVVHVGAGIGNALEQIIMNLLRRCPAVPSYQNFFGVKQSGEKITHLVGSLLVEIHIVDSAYVICVKSSHN